MFNITRTNKIHRMMKEMKEAKDCPVLFLLLFIERLFFLKISAHSNYKLHLIAKLS